LDNIVKIHGIRKSIVSDRDKVFTSAFWTELFKLLRTELKLSPAYHPQIDGQTERVNQCLEIFLRCTLQATPRQWVKWLPLAELWYNTSYHSSLQCTPFKDLYGTDHSLGMLPQLQLTDHKDVSDMLRER
jgi:transposase InsO family protein